MSINTLQQDPEPISSYGGTLLAVRYDVRRLLVNNIGQNWEEQVEDLVRDSGELVVRSVAHESCRELDPETKVGLVTVCGDDSARAIPGLWQLYQNDFFELMQQSLALVGQGDYISKYEEPSLGLELVRQTPADLSSGHRKSMEAHVDQRFTGVLVLQAPELETEGRLVIGNNPEANGLDKISEGAAYIVHKAGTLVCFVRGRKYPHYTEEISKGIRTVCALNYPHIDESPDQAAEIAAHIAGAGL